MSDHRYKCPSCEAVLKTAAAIPAGKAIKCPKCQTPFKASANVVATRPAAVTAPVKKPVKSPPAPVPDEDDEDRVQAQAPKARKGAAKSKPPPPEDDEDDEDQEEKPARSKKDKKAKKGDRRSKLPLILGAGAGLLILAGAAVGGLYAFGVFDSNSAPLKTYPAPQPPAVGDQPLGQVIVGRWKSTSGSMTHEYKADGTLSLTHANGSTLTGTYKVLNDREIELRVRLNNNESVIKETYIVKGDQLTCTDQNNKVTTYERVRDAGGGEPLVKAIVGKWNGGGSIYDYNADGTITIMHPNGSSETGTYKVLNDTDVERRMKLIPGKVFMEKCVVKGNELTITDEMGISILQRVR